MTEGSQANFGSLALPKSPPKQKMSERYPYIDVVKSLAIIGVVVAHCFPMGAVLSSNISDRILAWVVPSFFACSGFMYSRGATYTATLRRVGRILCPYFFATLTMWALRAWRPWEGRPALSWKVCASELVYGDAAAPYYFVFELVMLVAASPILAACPRWLVQVLLPVSIALTVCSKIWLDYPRYLPLFWSIRNPLDWWGYFVVGWLSPLFPQVRPSLAFLALLAIFVLEGAAPSIYTALVLSYGFCMLVPSLFPPSGKLPGNGLMVWISSNTYTIMLYHPGFLELMKGVNPDPKEMEMTGVHFDTSRLLMNFGFAFFMPVALAYFAPKLIGPTLAKGIFGCMPEDDAAGKEHVGGPGSALLAKPQGQPKDDPGAP